MRRILKRSDKYMQTGKVKFFNGDKGFGFITPDDGGKDIFFHVSQVKTTGNMAEHDKVSFDTEQGDRGLTATNVSRINS